MTFIAEDGSEREEYLMQGREVGILKGCFSIETEKYWSCNDQYCKFFKTCKRYEQNIKDGIQPEINRMTQIVENKIKIKPGIELPEELERKMEELKQRDDEIRFAQELLNDLLNTEELVKANKTYEKINTKINKIEEKLCIPTARETLNQLITTQKMLITTLGNKIPPEYWGKDSFKKGKDAASSKDGEIVLIRGTTTKRTIPLRKMLDQFPFAVQELADEGKIKVTLKDAETKLNKSEIDDLCDKTIDHTYELRIKDGRDMPQSSN